MYFVLGEEGRGLWNWALTVAVRHAPVSGFPESAFSIQDNLPDARIGPSAKFNIILHSCAQASLRRARIRPC
jgi:hypothetical protein